MPFTPTHILAVVPIVLVFKRLPLFALSIGAVIPDFPLFFALSSYAFSHSLLGIFFYCLPAGLILYVISERIGKPFFIDMSPHWIRSRLTVYREQKLGLNTKAVILVMLALLIGSVTHVAWDEFTHLSGWGVSLYPDLVHKIHLLGFSMPIYKAIQYGSTFIGLPVLFIIWVNFILRLEPELLLKSCRSSKIKRILMAVSFLVIPVLLFCYYRSIGVSISNIVGYTIKESIGANIVLFFLYASIHRWRGQNTETD